MSLQVQYGLAHTFVDVTHRVWRCVIDGVLHLPAEDTLRAGLLGDPLPNVVKELYIHYNNESWIFPDGKAVTLPIPDVQVPPLDPHSWKKQMFTTAQDKVEHIHDNLYFHGNIMDEYPEQLLIAQFLQPSNIVLEIGANIGRSTLMIASILDDESNLVTLECDPASVAALTHHRDLNHMKFHIEPSALSSFPLYRRGWNTYYEYNKPDDAVPVDTITLAELREKYPLPFDTLVADCEGALAGIIGETPEILDGIKLVIVENDYQDIHSKLEVDRIFKSKGLVLHKNVPGGWGPCTSMFYQVWKAK